MTKNNDAELIKSLGGPAALGRTLGYTTQRVSNWSTRGIPPLLKYQRADLFGVRPPKSKRQKK